MERLSAARWQPPLNRQNRPIGNPPRIKSPFAAMQRGGFSLLPTQHSQETARLVSGNAEAFQATLGSALSFALAVGARVTKVKPAAMSRQMAAIV